MFCKNCGKEINNRTKFCKYCGSELKIGRFLIFQNRIAEWLRNHHKGTIIIVGIVFLIIISIFYEDSSSPKDSYSPSQPQNVSEKQYSPTFLYNQEEITATVVNIFCESALSNEESSGGSGTIIDKDGLILTNSHVIPQDKDNLRVVEEGCVVILPDPVTGQPKDLYLADPIVISGISDKYDLAFMSIYAAYYNEEEQKYAGTYPRQFPAFDDTTRCKNENIQLGEPVRIFGYPEISGGYSLTITDGIVSSFPGEGLIMTSAKVSYGNSGGLAVDRNGCMIGVPSMFSSDENESLGVIISTDLISKFTEEAEQELKKNSNDGVSKEQSKSLLCNGSYWSLCPTGKEFYCPPVGDPFCCDGVVCNNECWTQCPIGQKFICPSIGDAYCY